MATQSKTTTDHDTIRRWAEKRGAVPSTVSRTRSAKDVGVIRLDFPGFSGEGSLEQISWDQFFDKFDSEGLAFVYQDKTAAGKTSSFNRFVKRETAMARTRGTKKAGARTGMKRTARAGAAKKTASRAGGAKKTATRKTATTKRPAKAAASKRPTKRAASTKRTGATKRTTKRTGMRARG